MWLLRPGSPHPGVGYPFIEIRSLLISQRRRTICLSRGGFEFNKHFFWLNGEQSMRLVPLGFIVPNRSRKEQSRSSKIPPILGAASSLVDAHARGTFCQTGFRNSIRSHESARKEKKKKRRKLCR